MIYIIADDLTGANDTGVQFSKRGYRTVVSIINNSPILFEDTDVMVVDIETREIEPSIARKRVKQVLEKLNPGKNDIVYKKVDSTLRGCIGAEIEEIMNFLQMDICIFSPTFSFNKRITVGGYLIVQGTILELSNYGNEDIEPGEASYIPSLLERQTDLPVSRIELKDVAKGPDVILEKIKELYEKGIKIVVIDAADETHLQNIIKSSFKFDGSILYSGSAGLANHLLGMNKGHVNSKIKALDNERPVLAVCATRQPVMKSQIDYLKGRVEFCEVIVDLETIFAGRASAIEEYSGKSVKALNERRDVVIHTDPLNTEKMKINEKLVKKHGLKARELELTIRNFLGELTAAVVRKSSVRSLILSGGDTALGVCSALDLHNLYILDELFPGIPVSMVDFGDLQLKLVTKAGGFGEEDTLFEIIDKMSLNIGQRRQVLT